MSSLSAGMSAKMGPNCEEQNDKRYRTDPFHNVNCHRTATGVNVFKQPGFHLPRDQYAFSGAKRRTHGVHCIVDVVGAGSYAFQPIDSMDKMISAS